MKLVVSFLTAAAAGAGALAAAIGAGGPAAIPAGQPVETVLVQPGSLAYRLPGEYLAASLPVDAPLRRIDFPRGVEMMKYQVSAADYARCVADGACGKAEGAQARDDMPATGIDYRDATDYAAWLSRKTGQSWRLPTDAEWTFAAAERFTESALGNGGDGANPAARWLASYDREARNTGDPQPRPRGSFGTNSKGLADMAGNVWDWTSTCYVRASIEDGGELDRSVKNCGVYVAAGKHRAYMSFFIRDGKSGGCAAGLAPSNLGVRLVRDPPSLLAKARTLLRLAG